MVHVFYRGFELLADREDDPHVFAVDFSAWGMGKVHVAFIRDFEGRTTRCVLDVMPITLRKRADSRNPRRWALHAGLGVAGAGLALPAVRSALGRGRPEGSRQGTGIRSGS